MRGSSVTAARSCLQPLVSASRYLAVHALPGDPLYFIVDVKSKVKEVYSQTCQLLGQQGMQDCELFGLAILSDGEYLFVESENKLSKYAPKNWRSSHTYGLDSSGRPAFILYFRVRYYVDTPLLLSDETTRHHYYLQLRDNVIRHGGGVDSWPCQQHPLLSSSVYGPLLSLAGLALQADLGDYTEERHRRSQGYCKPSEYLPAHMCHEENALTVLAAQHKDNQGLSREEAELAYIREAVLLEAPLNAHLYRLRRSKSEQGPGRVLLAICASGVRIYGDEDVPQVFTWNNICKLGFDRKKFEIRVVDRPAKLTLFSGCDDKSKLLLALCRDTHQFFMSIAPRVNEAKRQEEEARKVLRDCYMYPVRCKLSLTTRGSRADQRISLISSTSSNTTSGIVSDRVHSEDEPDAGPVSAGSNGSAEADPRSLVESAASSKSGSASQAPTTATSDIALDEVGAVPRTAQRPTLACPALGETAAAAAAELSNGAALSSQCSSTCSTIVVSSPASATCTRRRTSIGSSLELGYSHTAQNSNLSAEQIYDRCNKTAKYADIASETSGVYTLHSSEMLDEAVANDSSVQSVTTDEASVTSGFYTIHSGLRSETSDSCYSQGTGHDDEQEEEPIYSICHGEEAAKPTVPSSSQAAKRAAIVDESESRSRSNSILSTSSFRGDGTDPPSQGPLLSADELSDLIVGRYPPRKSVGASLDSDCDYVRLPPPPLPPPAPPPRTDSERKLPPPPPYPGSACPQPVVVKHPPPPPYAAVSTTATGTSKINNSCAAAASCPRERFEIPPPTPPRNDAITPREPPPPPPPPSRIQPPTYPGDKMKPTPVHAPVAALVVGPNNYLDVHATRTGPVLLPYLSPPPQQAQQQAQQRQPPPPPPPSAVIASSNCPAAAAQKASISSGPSLALQTSANNSTGTPAGGMLATVYTSQVARTQIEQYKQQLYSDVDYVMFPLKDPALSQQEYIDAKQGSLLAAMAAYPPPPPYPLQTVNKSSPMYKSSPYLSYATNCCSSSSSSSFALSNKYASNQNLMSSSLSDTNSSVGANYQLLSYTGKPGSQYAASTSSLYSGLTYSSGGASSQAGNSIGLPAGGSCTYTSPASSHQTQTHPPPAPPPLPPPPLPPPASTKFHQHSLQHGFSRTRSHENILKSYDTSLASLSSLSLSGSPAISRNGFAGSLPHIQTKHRRLPPPPPPPPYGLQSLPASRPSCIDDKGSINSESDQLQAHHEQKQQHSQSKKEQQDQTQENVMLDIKTLREKSRNLDLPLISALCNDRYLLKQTKAFVLPKHPNDTTGSNSNTIGVSSRHKYPVSGLSTTQISKPARKPANSAHKHAASLTPRSSKSINSVSNAYQVNNSNTFTNDQTNTAKTSHS